MKRLNGLLSSSMDSAVPRNHTYLPSHCIASTTVGHSRHHTVQNRIDHRRESHIYQQPLDEHMGRIAQFFNLLDRPRRKWVIRRRAHRYVAIRSPTPYPCPGSAEKLVDEGPMRDKCVYVRRQCRAREGVCEDEELAAVAQNTIQDWRKCGSEAKLCDDRASLGDDSDFCVKANGDERTLS
jgi:hypothetical protein